jgi:hypothetical protein
MTNGFQLFQLSEIDFSTIDFYYTSYSERKGIYLNKYLVCSWGFVVQIHLIDEITMNSIHGNCIHPDTLFYAHSIDFDKGIVDRDPCKIYSELTGKPHSACDVSLTPEEYMNNKNNLVANIKGILREDRINKILE